MRQGSTRLVSLFAIVAVASLIPVTRTSAGEGNALPDSRLGMRVAPLLLLTRSDIRADLELTNEQTASAEKAIEKFHVEARALIGKPDTEVTKRARRAVDDEAFAWIDTRLNAEQKTRLAQLDLQWEGPSALVTRAVVSRSLHLSEEQVNTLKTAIQQRDEARKKGDTDADRTLATRALACLDERQRESWLVMLGKPIEFRRS